MSGLHHHHGHGHGHGHAHGHHHAAIGNDKLKRLATYASVSVATVLIVAKLVAYLLTDSVAMLSSLLDSTIDLAASLVTVYGVASALRPPDRDHRFGHGKAEPLAALGQSAFIAGSSIFLGYEALSRLYHPHQLQHETLAYAIMGFAIAVTIVLVWFQNYVIGRSSSMAIGADRLHYIGDLAVNVGVMLAFFLYEKTGWGWFDPLFSVLIAAGLAVSAYHIAVHALHVLMDRELPDADREKIKSIVLAQASVRGVHDLRTRSDSDRIFVEMHIELDPEMNLREAHYVCDAVTKAVSEAYPGADVTTHQDPVGLEEQRLDASIADSAVKLDEK